MIADGGGIIHLNWLGQAIFSPLLALASPFSAGEADGALRAWRDQLRSWFQAPAAK